MTETRHDTRITRPGGYRLPMRVAGPVAEQQKRASARLDGWDIAYLSAVVVGAAWVEPHFWQWLLSLG